MKRNELYGILSLVGLCLLVQLVAADITPSLADQMTYMAPGDQQTADSAREDYKYIFVVLAVLLVETLGIVLAIRMGWRRLINRLLKLFFFASVVIGCFVVILGAVSLLFPTGGPLTILGASLLLSIAISVHVFVYPEWYNINLTGVLVCAGMAAAIGFVVGPLPCIVFMIVMAAYDFIAVYKTKHMIELAERMLELRLPLFFVVPLVRGFKYRDAHMVKPGEERTCFTLGLGDAFIPALLVVSAKASLDLPMWAAMNLPMIGTMLGTMLAIGLLACFVGRTNKPAPGLPLICSGAILGYAAGYLVAIV